MDIHKPNYLQIDKEEAGWFQPALMAIFGFLMGIGVPADDVYSTSSIVLLTCALATCAAALIIPRPKSSKPGNNLLLTLLAVGILAQTVYLLFDRGVTLPDVLAWPFNVRLAAAGILGLTGLLRSRAISWLRVALVGVIFCIHCYVIVRVYAHPLIDVFQLQAKGAQLLAHGGNPFDPAQVKYSNVYPREGVAFLYTPDTVDFTPTPESPNGTLRIGFPYPPLSLFLVTPAQMLAGDIRYAHIAAILLSAGFMSFAVPGRRGALASCLFLFTPRVFYIVCQAWTEPLLVFTFSLAMFCACRFPRLLPWALGAFLATKQYSVLLVPLILLLADNPTHSWKTAAVMFAKAIGTAAVITLPIAFLDFHDFWHSVVQWQLIQPFRLDSTSFLVTLAHWFHGWQAPSWVAFAFTIPAILLALWKCARTPAGFATGVALVNLVFFFFNKRAFTNYYYLSIAAAWWAVAVQDAIRLETKPDAATEIH